MKQFNEFTAKVQEGRSIQRKQYKKKDGTVSKYKNEVIYLWILIPSSIRRFLNIKKGNTVKILIEKIK